MKNPLILFTTLALLSLAACGGDSGSNSGDGDDTSSSSVTPASSGIPSSSGEGASSGIIPGSSVIPASAGISSSSSGVSPASSGASSSSGVIPASSVTPASSGASSSSSGDITSFTDPRDGQVYPVVRIGTQVWFAKNLNVGTMVSWDGSSTVYTVSTDDTKIEKLCYGNNAANCDTYGGLYEFIEALGYPATCEDADWVNSPTLCPHDILPAGKRGICPVGWHIPDTTEFNILFQYVHDNGYAGRENVALRASNLNSGLDAFGFSVLGGGYVYISGDWLEIGQEGYLWSSTVGTDYMPRYNNWDTYDDFLVVHDHDRAWTGYGLSIRCVQD